jgi:xanthine dehydrogenase YagT iron-sulfur-binding subunit
VPGYSGAPSGFQLTTTPAIGGTALWVKRPPRSCFAESLDENHSMRTALSAGPTEFPMTLTINAEARAFEGDPRRTLLDFLRLDCGLTGTKKGCDHGQCGACTVLINGQRINSCLTLAIMHDGDSITTIEGLGRPEHLHPLQAAFVRRDGYQCGYCTPGQICSAAGMLREAALGWPSFVTDDLAAEVDLTPTEIRERMSGNLCRCGAYSNIVDAITDLQEGGR